MSKVAHLHLFEGYGIEMEYMIVDRKTLAAKPIADKVLAAEAGDEVNEVERGDMAWSNELVLHVLELKTNGPDPDLAGLSTKFQREVIRVNEVLAPLGAKLMPTAMHPLFEPAAETRLWPHGDKVIYAAYDRIFGCKGHGWSNLQSVHINLPFFDDAEFGRLHAAVRLALPILPALAASSPIYQGKLSGLMDSRLEFYRHNQRAVPKITGGVIPERAYSRAQYDEMIFQPVFQAIRPFDPEGILQEEWLNSRGAIARFDRNAIEIRVLDIQESPRMDAAVIHAVVSLVQALVHERWCSYKDQQQWHEERLRPIFVDCLNAGDAAYVSDPDYLKALGFKGRGPVKASELWRHLAQDLTRAGDYPVKFDPQAVSALTDEGCLSRRIVKALGPVPSVERVCQVYDRLCDLLAAGGIFTGAA